MRNNRGRNAERVRDWRPSARLNRLLLFIYKFTGVNLITGYYVILFAALQHFFARLEASHNDKTAPIYIGTACVTTSGVKWETSEWLPLLDEFRNWLMSQDAWESTHAMSLTIADYSP